MGIRSQCEVCMKVLVRCRCGKQHGTIKWTMCPECKELDDVTNPHYENPQRNIQ